MMIWCTDKIELKGLWTAVSSRATVIWSKATKRNGSVWCMSRHQVTLAHFFYCLAFNLCETERLRDWPILKRVSAVHTMMAQIERESGDRGIRYKSDLKHPKKLFAIASVPKINRSSLGSKTWGPSGQRHFFPTSSWNTFCLWPKPIMQELCWGKCFWAVKLPNNMPVPAQRQWPCSKTTCWCSNVPSSIQHRNWWLHCGSMWLAILNKMYEENN